MQNTNSVFFFLGTNKQCTFSVYFRDKNI